MSDFWKRYQSISSIALGNSADRPARPEAATHAYFERDTGKLYIADRNLQWVLVSDGVGGGGGGSGVSSVGLSVNANASDLLAVTGSPVTSSGTITLSAPSQTQNTVYAAPDTANGTPTFRTLTLNDLPSSLVTETGTETLANKTLTSPVIGSFDAAQHSHINAQGGGTLDTAAIASGTFPKIRLPSDAVYLNETQTLAGKTLTQPSISDFSSAQHAHTSAATGGGLDAAAIASGTLPKARVPSDTVYLNDAQTLTAKTLTQPIIGNFTSAQHTHADAQNGGTLPASAIGSGTLAKARMPSDAVYTADAQTLSSKTLVTPAIASFISAQHNHQSAIGGGLLDVGAIGSGSFGKNRLPADTVYLNDAQTLTAKTLTQPTINNYINAQHNHMTPETGGGLPAAAIVSGTIDPNRILITSSNVTDFPTAVQTIIDANGGGGGNEGHVVTDLSLAAAGVTVLPELAARVDRYTQASDFIVHYAATSPTAPTWSPSAPNTVGISSAVTNHLYAFANDTTLRWGTYTLPITGDFSFTTKVHLGGRAVANTVTIGFGVMSTNLQNGAFIVLQVSGTGSTNPIINGTSLLANTATGRGSAALGANSTYMRITRTGTSMRLYVSTDGIAWLLINAPFALTFTANVVGFRMQAVGTGNTVELVSPFIRGTYV